MNHSPTERITDIFGNFKILNELISNYQKTFEQFEITLFFSDGRKRKLICKLENYSMCTRPIRIPKKGSNPLTPDYIFVPCNRCLACQKAKSDGIEYRALKEYDYAKEHNGSTYFITFTYDDEHLPFMRSFRSFGHIGNTFFGKMPEDAIFTHKSKNEDSTISSEEIHHRWYEFTEEPCHDKKDLQNFNKRLRSALHSRGYDLLISYFIASEYGHDNKYVSYSGHLRQGTKRPHYHAMYNVIPLSGSVPSYDEFLYLAYKSWNMCIPECFQSELIGNKVISAIGYISKYICKDDSYKEFASRCINSDSGVTFQIYDRKQKTFVDCKESRVAPFTLVSKNFGAKHLLECDIEFLASELQKKVSILNQTGGKYDMPYPVYYKKKFLYETTKNTESVSEMVDIPIYGLNTLNATELEAIESIEYKSMSESTSTMPKSIYLPYLIEQKREFKHDLYLRLKGYYFSLEIKPFSMQFLNFALEDYLYAKDMHHDINNLVDGIYDYSEIPLHKCILSTFYNVPVSSVDTFESVIDSFIYDYQSICYKQTHDKLYIMREKARKRSAEKKYIKFNVRKLL